MEEGGGGGRLMMGDVIQNRAALAIASAAPAAEPPLVAHMQILVCVVSERCSKLFSPVLHTERVDSYCLLLW